MGRRDRHSDLPLGCELPPGYRLLEDGERIWAGDKCFTVLGVWRLVDRSRIGEYWGYHLMPFCRQKVDREK